MARRQTNEGFQRFPLDYFRKGFSYVVPGPGTHYFHESFDEDVWLSGAIWEAGDGSVPFADRFHFEVTDVDGLLGYGPGAMLGRHAEDEYLGPGRRGEVLLPDARRIYQGLYLTTVAVATGPGSWPFRISFHLRRKAV